MKSPQKSGKDRLEFGVKSWKNRQSIEPPAKAGGWSADFLDPDGLGLGLYQSADKSRSLK